jgi:hypothetical protein
LLVRAEAQITRLQQAIDRLIDGYTEGYIDKPAFTARMERSRERLARLTTEAQSLREQVHSQAELQRLVSGLENFSDQVAAQLEQADWVVKRKVLCATAGCDSSPQPFGMCGRDPAPCP